MFKRIELSRNGITYSSSLLGHFTAALQVSIDFSKFVPLSGAFHPILSIVLFLQIFLWPSFCCLRIYDLSIYPCTAI